jgi:DNA-binding HxlR family transcriptional regulator
MRTYGQYCPIARTSEILAERWTPIIIRNLLSGATTFTDIAKGAPGIPRSLLANRLRELQHAGVVEASPNPSGHGSVYRLSEAGQELRAVIMAMGAWGDRWLELASEHTDPSMVLHSWVTWYLAEDELPERTTVARFDFPDQPARSGSFWVVFDGSASEVCRLNPGFEEHLIITAESRALTEWHLGEIEWRDAVAADRIQVSGDAKLATALPTWNRRSPWAGSRADSGPSG